MLVAQLVEIGRPLEFVDRPLPVPAPDDVVIKVEACGICHTDLHIWRGEHPVPRPLPIVLGHEAIGRVVKVGANVPPTLIGTRVGAGYVHSTCGHCRPCLTGHETYCRHAVANGYSTDGFFAEYAIGHYDWTIPIESDMAPEQVAPLMCAGVTAYSALRKTMIEPGQRIAIFGCGGLGLYAIQFAKIAGAEVIAVDRDERKLVRAKQLGADHVLSNANGADISAGIAATGKAAAVLNFAPSISVWPSLLEIADQRARVVLVALPPGEVELRMAHITETGITVTGSADGTRQELHDVLALAEKHGVVSSIRILPFAEINRGIEEFSQGQVEGRLVVSMAKPLDC